MSETRSPQLKRKADNEPTRSAAKLSRTADSTASAAEERRGDGMQKNVERSAEIDAGSRLPRNGIGNTTLLDGTPKDSANKTYHIGSDRIRKLFDWLSGRKWADEYFTSSDGICVSVRPGVISVEDAEAEMTQAHFEDVLLSGRCCFSKPSQVEFAFTADPELAPGSLIKSSSQRCVLYSGSIRSAHMKLRGMTVGHFLQSEGDCICTEQNIQLSEKICCCKEINGNPEQDGGSLITADLCLFSFILHEWAGKNAILHDGAHLSVRLWTGDIECESCIVIIDQNGKVRTGKIWSNDYNKQSDRLYRTLRIRHDVPEEGSTEPGDSGALVMYRGQNEDPTYYYVVGIVIGYMNAAGSFPKTTIANRLHDVLKAIGKNPDYVLMLKDTDDEVADVMEGVEFAEQNE